MNKYPPRQEFKACDGCAMPSACKVGYNCTKKRKKREEALLERAAHELCRMRGESPNELAIESAAIEITRHNQVAEAISHALRGAL